MSNHARLACAALAGPLLVACANVPIDHGRADVAALIRARGVPEQTTAAVEAARATPLALDLGALRLDDAVRLALTTNPGLRAEYARLGFAAGDVHDASRLSNPTLSIAVLLPDVAAARNQVGFGLVQSFTDLLLLPARRRLAEGEFERVKSLVAHAVITLTAAVETAYYRLASARQSAQVAAAIAEAARTSADLAQRFFDAGNLNRLTLALEQAAAADARMAVLAAEDEVAMARAALAQLLGMPPARDDWQIVSGLAAPLPVDDEVEALLALAGTTRLDLLAARRRTAVLADALGLTRKTRLLGRLDAGVETERQTDGSRLTGPVFALELPLFNQGQGRLARGQAALEEAEAALAALEIGIGADVRRAHRQVALAKARADQYREHLIPLRETIVAETQAQVNYMLSGAFELLQARQRGYEAYRGYLVAVRDYWMARVELARLIGTALPSGLATTAPLIEWTPPAALPVPTAPAPHAPSSAPVAPSSPASSDHTHHGDTP